MRFATIDVGTNTAQLLVVEVVDGVLSRVHVAERFVRLGEGVDASGRIGEAAQDRLLSTLKEHVDTAREHGAERIVAAATSAMRDAANRDAVRQRVKEETGLDVDLLSGDEEATWSFAAACAPFAGLDAPRMVVDVGGGSTELIVGRPPGPEDGSEDGSDGISSRVSLDVGCIRLTERCFDGQPPSDASAREAEAVIREALDGANVDVPDGTVLIGTAGTATALARVHEGPDAPYDALRDAGTTLSAREVRTWRDRILTLSVDEIRELHPAAMDGRADVFCVGVMLLDAVMHRFGFETMRVSPFELRYGLALRALQGGSAVQPQF